jgi:hypothetical protein
MIPISADDEKIRENINELLNLTHEVFIEEYLPHSGGSGDYYFIATIEHFNQLVDRAKTGIYFFISKQPQLPLRGIVDDQFISLVKDHIPEGTWYMISRISFYPQKLLSYGSGDTHDLLENDLHDLTGLDVCVGIEPYCNVEYWNVTADEKWIVLSKT